MKNKTILLLTLITVLTFSACSGAVDTNGADDSDGTSYEAVREYTNGELVISYDSAAVDIKASYPVLRLEDESVCERINGEIMEYIDSVYGRYYSEAELSAVDMLASTMLYDVTLFSEDIVSIHFYSSYAGGGSPQYVNDYALTFDLHTGEKISLSELYTAGQLSEMIDDYFDNLDESLYPMLFSLYTKEQVKSDFKSSFNPESERADTYFYHSYYISEDKLFLTAGWYKGYTLDISSPLQGERAFTAEISAAPDYVGISLQVRSPAV